MKRLNRGIALILCLLLALPAARADEKANPSVAAWCDAYNTLMLNISSNLSDVLLVSGNIQYAASDIDQSRGVSMVYGGAYSPESTYAIGMGSGLENDDLWYVSFTYYNAQAKDIQYTMLCSILSSLAVGVDLGGQDEAMESARYILSALISADSDVAMELDGVVFVFKSLSSGLLFALDSKAYYDTFYKGSISNYQVIR